MLEVRSEVEEDEQNEEGDHCQERELDESVRLERVPDLGAAERCNSSHDRDDHQHEPGDRRDTEGDAELPDDEVLQRVREPGESSHW